MRRFAIATWALVWSAAAQAGTVDRIAAVVNDEVVALSEVYDLGSDFIEERCAGLESDAVCRVEAEKEVLDSLILRTLISQELGKLSLQVTAEEVDRTIDQIGRDQAGLDREELRQEVERQGIAWDLYRQQIEEQLKQMRFTEVVIRPRVAISDDELLDRYKRQVREVESVQMRDLEGVQLPIPAGASPEVRGGVLRLAQSLADEVNAGERAWSDVVTEYAQGAFAERQGQMGSFKPGQLNERLDAAAFNTPVGKVSVPVDFGAMVFLVRPVRETESADVAPFEEAKPRLMQAVYEEKLDEEIERWYQQTRRRASVRLLLDAP